MRNRLRKLLTIPVKAIIKERNSEKSQSNISYGPTNDKMERIAKI